MGANKEKKEGKQIAGKRLRKMRSANLMSMRGPKGGLWTEQGAERVWCWGQGGRWRRGTEMNSFTGHPLWARQGARHKVRPWQASSVSSYLTSENLRFRALEDPAGVLNCQSELTVAPLIAKCHHVRSKTVEPGKQTQGCFPKWEKMQRRSRLERQSQAPRRGSPESSPYPTPPTSPLLRT